MKTTTGNIEATKGPLRFEDIERLSDEEFEALPEAVKQDYFELMARENSPSPAEFYGWHEEDLYEDE